MHMKKMKIQEIDPRLIEIPFRLRKVDKNKVRQIAESMAAIGLQQPITVWSMRENEVELIAGAHRLQAAVDLGWEWIDVVFHDDWSEIDRQLWEIDENLLRAELSPTEHADHMKRRKELWEAREKMGGKSSLTHDSSGRKKHRSKQKVLHPTQPKKLVCRSVQ